MIMVDSLCADRLLRLGGYRLSLAHGFERDQPRIPVISIV